MYRTTYLQHQIHHRKMRSAEKWSVKIKTGLHLWYKYGVRMESWASALSIGVRYVYCRWIWRNYVLFWVKRSVSDNGRSDDISSLDGKSQSLTKTPYHACFQCTADVLNGPPLRTASQTDALTILGAHRGLLMTSRSPQVWCTVWVNFASEVLCALDFICICDDNTVTANFRFDCMWKKDTGDPELFASWISCMCTSSTAFRFSQTAIFRSQLDYIILPYCLTGVVNAGIEWWYISTRFLQVRDTRVQQQPPTTTIHSS